MKLCKDCKHCIPDPFYLWNPRRIDLWPPRIYRQPSADALKHSTCALAPHKVIVGPVDGAQTYENYTNSSHHHCCNLRAEGVAEFWPIDCGPDGKLWEPRE